MVKVLKDWEEIGRSVDSLRRYDSGFHEEPTKNWDLAQIAEILESLDRRAKILDLGCGGSQVLKFCHQMGFRDILGLDIRISPTDRFHQLHSIGRNLKRGHLRMPYRLLERDLMKTRLSGNRFDFIVCLSVIEHGVDPDLFFSESARLLKEGGLMYLSTDYSERKISTDGIRMFGLEWNIFSRDEIRGLMYKAKEYGLEPVGGMKIPRQKNGICEVDGKSYTFLSVVFKKAGASNR